VGGELPIDLGLGFVARLLNATSFKYNAQQKHCFTGANDCSSSACITLQTNKEPLLGFEEQIPLMTKILYNKQRRENDGLHLDPGDFQRTLEEADFRLQGFLSKMEKAIIPPERSAYNKKEARKQIVLLCYTIAGMRNKFVNDLKLEIGLSLDAAGTKWNGIDRMNKCGYSVDPKTLENYKKMLVERHSARVQEFFMQNVR
jgi:hypothetical protein